MRRAGPNDAPPCAERLSERECPASTSPRRDQRQREERRQLETHRVACLVTAAMSPSTSTDILIYVALSEEFDAILVELPGKFEPFPLASITLIGYRGEIATNSGSYDVVIVPAGKMGNTRSAGIAAVVVAEFKPQTMVVLGIAGSLSGDLQLGDVFLPDSAKEFLANAAAGEDGADWTLQLSGNELSSNGPILNGFQNLKHTHSQLFAAWQGRTQALGDQLVPEPVRQALREREISFAERAQLKAGEDRKLASGPIVGKGKQFARWLKEFSDRKFVALEIPTIR